MSALLQALKDEMKLRHNYIESPETIYIGGGTPSLYRAEELGGLIEEAKKLWGCHLKEVTVELNPEDVTPDYCQTLAEYGVNRLSIGIQSFDDNHLRIMNRRHSAAQGVRAVEAARKAGFQNVSIDLIFGFHGLTMEQWRSNIKRALSLAPEHLSAYQLGIEPGTLFDQMVREGRLNVVEQEVAAAQYALLQELMSVAGMEQYEVSNFARKGYRSQHNSAYWQGICYLGIGPSAHSFNGTTRHANVRSLGRYIKGVAEGRLAIKEEQIGPQKRYNEFVMTRLRTVEGICKEELEQHHVLSGQKIRRHFASESARLVQQGLLLERPDAITIPPQKWFVSDGIIMRLMV